MHPQTPCRLFVIMARDAAVAVILRRGPTKWFQVIKWETRHDTFEDGAWFHGRIYEDACNLSPDGKMFVYFASKYGRQKWDDEYGEAWTAISRPPWLHALALWSSPCGAWPGGGRFSDNHRLHLLKPGKFDLVPHPNHPPPRDLIVDVQDWVTLQFESKSQSEPKPEIEGANWSGRDQQHRIVFARDGKLFRRENWKDRQLIDFNDRQPDPQPAPDWARR